MNNFDVINKDKTSGIFNYIVKIIHKIWKEGGGELGQIFEGLQKELQDR
jgi:hypothetical protein